MHAFDSINHFFLISQMIIPGSSYWNIGIDRAKSAVEQAAETLWTLSRRPLSAVPRTRFDTE
jgi:hypothetical protein